MRRMKGFTLIELLIVVAIIAILAAIAIPNFMEAQVRSKVSRVKNDFRALATSLEAYRVDSQAYPPGIPANLDDGGAWLMTPLTTPVAYITSLPADPFPPAKMEGIVGFRTTYHYSGYPVTGHARVWGLMSDGPDREWNTRGWYMGFSPTLFYGGIMIDGTLRNDDWYLYDPTNGTVSRGDVFRGQDYNR